MEQSIKITVSLGTNIGNKLENLFTCIRMLQDQVGNIVETSSIYLTEPWGNLDQDSFYNMALCAQTTLAPIELLRAVKNIEKQMGRIPTPKIYQPRVIDIDIIYYGSSIIYTSDPQLSIPHPLLHKRDFVLIPLSEMIPVKTHPVLKLSSVELLSKLAPPGKTEIIMAHSDLKDI